MCLGQGTFTALPIVRLPLRQAIASQAQHGGRGDLPGRDQERATARHGPQGHRRAFRRVHHPAKQRAAAGKRPSSAVCAL